MEIKVCKGYVIIFRDNNTLNCKRGNLGVVTKGVARYRNYKSETRGTYYDKTRNKYRARIVINRKIIHLGLFLNREDAILARKQAERKYL